MKFTRSDLSLISYHHRIYGWEADYEFIAYFPFVKLYTFPMVFNWEISGRLMIWWNIDMLHASFMV